jgi:WD40 repeat protein
VKKKLVRDVCTIVNQYNAKFRGKLSFEFNWCIPPITSLAVMGTRLVAVGCLDDTVRIWDLWRGECVRTIKHPNVWLTLAINTELLACASNTDIRIWDVVGGRLLCRLPMLRVRSLVATVNGLAIISAPEKFLEIWHVEKQNLVHYLGSKAEHLCALSEGRQVAATFLDGSARVFDAMTGQCVAKMIGIGACCQLLGVSSGRVALCTGTQVCVWDPNKRFPTTFIDVPSGFMDLVQALCMLDNETLVSMSLAGVWHAWDVITGARLGTSNLPRFEKQRVSLWCGKIIMVGSAMAFLGDQRVSIFQ